MSRLSSEIPLLLRSDFCQAIDQCIADDKSIIFEPSSTKLSADEIEDLEGLKQKVESKQSFAEKAVFAFNFLGRIGLSQLARVASTGKHKDGEDNQQELATNLQMFWSSTAYRKRAEQLTRVLLHCCKSEKQLEQAIEKCIILGKNDLATYSLLNSDRPVSSSDFRMNALKACLLSANLGGEESQCLVKLTATNLIASNFITDGIQLLFLIDQGLDACKYLISQGLWAQSIAYSKMHPRCDFEEILLKYVDFLVNEQISYKSLAILLLASLSKYDRCIALVKTAAEPANLPVLEKILHEAFKSEQAKDIGQIPSPLIQLNDHSTTKQKLEEIALSKQ